ncbi:MAG: enoyl-CoA hydratase-related protein [archaeon]|nr:enoyl-CoA hydratase-related protein [archaeon]
MSSSGATASSSSSDAVLVREKSEGVVEVSLNNPELFNAFNDQIIGRLTGVFREELPRVRGLRAVVLTGTGSVFSAGADLNWMRRMADYGHEENVRDAMALFDMFYSIHACPVPVVGRINGSAIGGGSGLVCSCDFAFAVKQASFGFTEVKLGLLPAVISPFVIGRIGQSAASRYFLTGERFGTDTAVRVGMVQEACDSEEALDRCVAAVTKHIVQSSPQSVAASKLLVHKVAGSDILSLKEHLANEIARLRVSPEGQHGLRSFLSKETPNWSQFL